MKTLKVIALLLVIALIPSCRNEMVAQKAIMNDVKGLIEECRTVGRGYYEGSNIVIIGKALVWDMHSDSRSGAYDMLSKSRQAESTDKQITVFMILDERYEAVGTYSISHETAYRQSVDVAVAVWPDKKAMGFYSVVEERPVKELGVSYGKADPNKLVADWIGRLRQVGQ